MSTSLHFSPASLRNAVNACSGKLSVLAAVLLTAICIGDAGARAPQPPPRAFSIVSAKVPRVLLAGSQFGLEVTLRNEGPSVWRKNGPVRLTYRWTKESAEHTAETGRRIRIGRTVQSGQAITLRIPLRAPDDLGTHQLQWRLVTRGQGAFSQLDNLGQQPGQVLIVPNIEYLFGWILPLLSCGLALLLTLWARRAPPNSVPATLAPGLLPLWGAVSIFGKPFLLYHDLDIHVDGIGIWLGASIAACGALALLPWGRRLRAGLTWTVAAGGALLVWANMLYARFFGDVLASGAFLATRQAGALTESILELAQPGDFLLLPDLLLGLLLVAVAMAPAPPGSLRRVRRVKAALAVLLAVAAVPAFVLSARAAQSKMGTGRRNLQTIRSVQKLGLHGFELQDIWTRVSRRWHNYQLSPEETEDLVTWFVETAPDRAGSKEWFGAAKGMNLVMVQVEALQQFVIGLEIGGQEVTPNLNRLFESGLSFSRVQSQIGQ
ncbi:MAG: NBR1-Ig-like domain-containing protein, partial [Thermoanaerobaculia bacterium]